MMNVILIPPTARHIVTSSTPVRDECRTIFRVPRNSYAFVDDALNAAWKRDFSSGSRINRTRIKAYFCEYSPDSFIAYICIVYQHPEACHLIDVFAVDFKVKDLGEVSQRGDRKDDRFAMLGGDSF